MVAGNTMARVRAMMTAVKVLVAAVQPRVVEVRVAKVRVAKMRVVAVAIQQALAGRMRALRRHMLADTAVVSRRHRQSPDTSK